MSLAVKLRLENLIFARAQTVKSAVYAQEGGLFSPARDAVLQALLFHYNVCYRAENFRQFCLPHFRGIRPWYGNNRPACTPVYRAQELAFEWMSL